MAGSIPCGRLSGATSWAKRWSSWRANCGPGEALGNYKSALQEYLQAAHAGAPVYRVKSESGPDHRKRFLVEVRLRPAEGEPGSALARGMGGTKKHAEQDAARRALARLTSSAQRNGSTGGDTMKGLLPDEDPSVEQQEQAAQ